MAVFTENSDLSRQAQSVYREGLKGKKKLIMNALGYNKHGERSKFGKVMPLLSFGGDMGARLLANKVSKGTHAEDMIKETNQEYWAAKGSQLKFTMEAAKLALGGGAGGGEIGKIGNIASKIGGKSGGKIGSIANTIQGGGSMSTATPPISGDVANSVIGNNDVSSVLSGGSDISSVGGDVSPAMTGGDETLDMPGSGFGSGGLFGDDSDPTYGRAMDSDVGQKIQEMTTNSEVKNAEDDLTEKIEEDSKEEKSEIEKLDKNLKKAKDVADKALPIVGAGIDWYQKAKAVGKEENRIKKKQLSRKVMANYNLL